jgi:hypothetical protein
LFDVGLKAGVHFLVLEYLDGETLAARMARGPLALPDALRIAIEIAAALDHAHRHGLVHRDLKPANVVLAKTTGSSTPTAKLLDFGLAKDGAGAVVAGAGAALSTVSDSLTARGTLLGTLQYMAPEQIEGVDADARTDIFAFGVVLYEMLTGRKAFEGKSQAGLLGAILKDEPPAVSQAQPFSPPALDHLVRTCLAKDPDARFQTARDVQLQLQWIAGVGGSSAGRDSRTAAPRRRERLLWAAAVLGAAALTSAGVHWFARAAASAPPVVTRFAYLLPDDQNLRNTGRHVVALSPDGTSLVYAANRQLYLHHMNQLDAQPIRGTDDPLEPVFSPDGLSLVFFTPANATRRAPAVAARRHDRHRRFHATALPDPDSSNGSPATTLRSHSDSAGGLRRTSAPGRTGGDPEWVRGTSALAAGSPVAFRSRSGAGL